MDTPHEYSWMSPLGYSTVLFLIHGMLYIVIGILTPFFWDKAPIKQPGLIMSYRTDKQLFKDEPSKIFHENASVYRLSQITFMMIAGLMVIAGVCITSLAWFGLRNGRPWALFVLAVVGLVGLPFWWLVFKPYFDADITITLADAPPFIWIPTLLYLPAVILGWLGLK